MDGPLSNNEGEEKETASFHNSVPDCNPSVPSTFWVQCDLCQKWRFLPGCREEDYAIVQSLSKWTCQMNRWDVTRAFCSAPEQQEHKVVPVDGSSIDSMKLDLKSRRNPGHSLRSSARIDPTEVPTYTVNHQKPFLRGLGRSKRPVVDSLPAAQNCSAYGSGKNSGSERQDKRLRRTLSRRTSSVLLKEDDRIAFETQFCPKGRRHVAAKNFPSSNCSRQGVPSNDPDNPNCRAICGNDLPEIVNKKAVSRGRGRWTTAYSRRTRYQRRDEIVSNVMLTVMQTVRWAQCDNCRKWRSLIGCSEEEYSKLDARQTWVCSDNVWDKARASCDAPEEDIREDLAAAPLGYAYAEAPEKFGGSQQGYASREKNAYSATSNPDFVAARIMFDGVLRRLRGKLNRSSDSTPKYSNRSLSLKNSAINTGLACYFAHFVHSRKDPGPPEPSVTNPKEFAREVEDQEEYSDPANGVSTEASSPENQEDPKFLTKSASEPDLKKNVTQAKLEEIRSSVDEDDEWESPSAPPANSDISGSIGPDGLGDDLAEAVATGGISTAPGLNGIPDDLHLPSLQSHDGRTTSVGPLLVDITNHARTAKSIFSTNEELDSSTKENALKEARGKYPLDESRLSMNVDVSHFMDSLGTFPLHGFDWMALGGNVVRAISLIAGGFNQPYNTSVDLRNSIAESWPRIELAVLQHCLVETPGLLFSLKRFCQALLFRTGELAARYARTASNAEASAHLGLKNESLEMDKTLEEFMVDLHNDAIVAARLLVRDNGTIVPSLDDVPLIMKLLYLLTKEGLEHPSKALTKLFCPVDYEDLLKEEGENKRPISADENLKSVEKILSVKAEDANFVVPQLPSSFVNASPRGFNGHPLSGRLLLRGKGFQIVATKLWDQVIAIQQNDYTHGCTRSGGGEAPVAKTVNSGNQTVSINAAGNQVHQLSHTRHLPHSEALLIQFRNRLKGLQCSPLDATEVANSIRDRWFAGGHHTSLHFNKTSGTSIAGVPGLSPHGVTAATAPLQIELAAQVPWTAGLEQRLQVSTPPVPEATIKQVPSTESLLYHVTSLGDVLTLPENASLDHMILLVQFLRFVRTATEALTFLQLIFFENNIPSAPVATT